MLSETVPTLMQKSSINPNRGFAHVSRSLLLQPSDMQPYAYGCRFCGPHPGCLRSTFDFCQVIQDVLESLAQLHVLQELVKRIHYPCVHGLHPFVVVVWSLTCV